MPLVAFGFFVVAVVLLDVVLEFAPAAVHSVGPVGYDSIAPVAGTAASAAVLAFAAPVVVAL